MRKGGALGSPNKGDEVPLYHAVARHIPLKYAPNGVTSLEIDHEGGDYVASRGKEPHAVLPKITPEIDGNRLIIEKSEGIEA